ncbi:MAG: cell division protein [Planctomycetota bacterium]|nr:MAG: cell division protein [Planctomycetota bacterium]
MRALLVAGLLALSAACADDRAAPAVPEGGRIPRGWVRVRLAESEQVELGCDGRWAALDLLGSELGSDASLPRATPLVASERGVRLGPLTLDTPTVELRPARDGDLRVNGRAYRGVMRIERLPGLPGQAARVRVTNLLPVDAYLRSVVPGEMPGTFGLTALSAQAVAARSYALNEMQERGWLWPDQRSQVYAGIDDESRLTDQAVQDTHGLLLVHDGKVLPAWFHSTCGGSTRPAREVYPFPPPGVFEDSVSCDDCRDSPFWRWTRSVPAERAAEAFGLEQPQLVSVSSDPHVWPAYAERVRLRTPAGESELDAETFRVRVSRDQRRASSLLSTYWIAPPAIENGKLVVRGGGWGHGVGLCQYGAAGAAARGLDARAILRRYYPGAQLVRLQ